MTNFIDKIMLSYLIINYNAQRMIGWSNFKDGLINIVLVHIAFLSSGFIIYFSSFFAPFSIYIVILYIIIYWLFLKKNVEKKLYEKIDFSLLEENYQKISYFKRILSVVISILMIFFSVIGTVYIVVLLKAIY